MVDEAIMTETVEIFVKMRRSWAHTFYSPHVIRQVEQEYNIMPRKAKPKLSAKARKNNEFTWLSGSLEPDDAAMIDDLLTNAEQAQTLVQELIMAGHSLSVKRKSPDEEKYTACLFYVDDEGHTYGLSAFATDPMTAFVVLAVKWERIQSLGLENIEGRGTANYG